MNSLKALATQAYLEVLEDRRRQEEQRLITGAAFKTLRFSRLRDEAVGRLVSLGIKDPKPFWMGYTKHITGVRFRLDGITFDYGPVMPNGDRKLWVVVTEDQHEEAVKTRSGKIRPYWFKDTIGPVEGYTGVTGGCTVKSLADLGHILSVYDLERGINDA